MYQNICYVQSVVLFFNVSANYFCQQFSNLYCTFWSVINPGIINILFDGVHRCVCINPSLFAIKCKISTYLTGLFFSPKASFEEAFTHLNIVVT